MNRTTVGLIGLISGEREILVCDDVISAHSLIYKYVSALVGIFGCVNVNGFRLAGQNKLGPRLRELWRFERKFFRGMWRKKVYYIQVQAAWLFANYNRCTISVLPACATAIQSAKFPRFGSIYLNTTTTLLKCQPALSCSWTTLFEPSEILLYLQFSCDEYCMCVCFKVWARCSR